MAAVKHRKANLDAVHAQEKARRVAAPEKQARLSLRKSAVTCGLDPDWIAALYKAHSGLCDICGRPPEAAIQPKTRLSLDHDHKTGKFRGFLCHDCNLMIGMASDEPKRLIAGAAYLEESG